MFKEFKKESKKIWGRTMLKSEELENDELQLGTLMRIATSLESLVKIGNKILKNLDK